MPLYNLLIRPLLFRLDAELAHHGTVEFCRWLGAIPGLPSLTRSIFEYRDAALQTEVAGLRFSNPLGLAAGWDKNGRAHQMLNSFGFGFAEIGSVSSRPSDGNPRPRLFRLPQDGAIIVNYGLPNDGALAVAARLQSRVHRGPLGINIVKTNDGPNAPACSDDAILADYEHSVRLLHEHANYLSLNLSCPNAKGGKDFFAQPANIARLLERLASINIQCPVFLKIAPHDDPAEHERVLHECENFSWIRGFCFNLPSGKPNTLQITTPKQHYAHLPGAVSGRPVEQLINRCIAGFYARMDRKRYVLIGTGGVFNAEEAYHKIRLGASLVQLYTAMIYEGPGVARHICRGLAELLKRDGFASVTEAVGTGYSRPCFRA
ncbi:MAG: quinone-dependent dihydroorotate dehydrogenase [Planctomycetaceae bacterium]